MQVVREVTVFVPVGDVLWSTGDTLKEGDLFVLSANTRTGDRSYNGCVFRAVKVVPNLVAAECVHSTPDAEEADYLKDMCIGFDLREYEVTVVDQTYLDALLGETPEPEPQPDAGFLTAQPDKPTEPMPAMAGTGRKPAVQATDPGAFDRARAEAPETEFTKTEKRAADAGMLLIACTASHWQLRHKKTDSWIINLYPTTGKVCPDPKRGPAPKLDLPAGWRLSDAVEAAIQACGTPEPESLAAACNVPYSERLVGVKEELLSAIGLLSRCRRAYERDDLPNAGLRIAVRRFLDTHVPPD